MCHNFDRLTYQIPSPFSCPFRSDPMRSEICRASFDPGVWECPATNYETSEVTNWIDEVSILTRD